MNFQTIKNTALLILILLVVLVIWLIWRYYEGQIEELDRKSAIGILMVDHRAVSINP